MLFLDNIFLRCFYVSTFPPFSNSLCLISFLLNKQSYNSVIIIWIKGNRLQTVVGWWQKMYNVKKLL